MLKDDNYDIKVKKDSDGKIKFYLVEDNQKYRRIIISVFQENSSTELCVFGELFKSFFEGSSILVKKRCTYCELRKYICDVLSKL